MRPNNRILFGRCCRLLDGDKGRLFAGAGVVHIVYRDEQFIVLGFDSMDVEIEEDLFIGSCAGIRFRDCDNIFVVVLQTSVETIGVFLFSRTRRSQLAVHRETAAPGVIGAKVVYFKIDPDEIAVPVSIEHMR